MEIQVFQLFSDDWEKFKSIRLEALEKEEDAFGTSVLDYIQREDSYWKEYLEKENNVVIVAQRKGVTVGMLRLDTSDSEIDEEYVYLGSVYVNSENRGMGIARKLMLFAEDYVKSNTSKKKILLEVYTHLKPAVKLYQDLDYRILEERVDDGIKDFVMIKNV
jgi:ribosomal protein S18 acetylase RimI-like enzyme